MIQTMDVTFNPMCLNLNLRLSLTSMLMGEGNDE